MKKHSFMSIISLLLVICLSLSIVPITAFAEENNSTSGLEDLIAGISSVEDIYGELDRETVPEIIGYDYAVSKAHVQRLYEAEDDDLNRVVFLNADGTQTAYIFDFPVKYIDERGAIKDITLDIADSNTLGQFETASGSSVTTFSRNANDGIRLVGNGTVLSLVPHIPVTRSGAELSSSSKITVSSTAKRIDNKTVSYDYDSKTTIEYSLTYTGFKEDIVVNEYTGQTEYDFTLYTNGLELTEIDGSFYLVDEENVVKATLGDIIIFTADEKNNTMGELNAQTIVVGQEYLLTIVVDPQFLASENTVYPIRIDPTVEICYDNNGAGAIADVTLNSNSGSSGTSGSLSVGLRETYGISRILMKFPGLNLSSLGNNITITNATVEIRDLMCEGTGLDVSCYVFSGNTWDESSANWSNVSPNSISTFLSSNVISYANGTQQATAHRYSFDITKAVEGWRTGNYNPNKGIIFKGPSSVENGSTYNCKTIASYNRASYKPSLSVTYSTTSNLIGNDTYYLNNRYCGDYLRYTSSSATATSGLISSLGNSIRWEIRSVNGGYVIRSKSDTTKYLGVPTSTSSTSVSVVTITDSTIPARCIWSISIANGGGCLVKNTYNSKYLYSSGNSVYTSSSTGSTGTSTYYSRVWRVASTSYYGNGSTYDAREVTAGTYITYTSTNVGKKKTPTISKYYSDEAWCSASDFTYSGYSSIISIDSLTGKITAKGTGSTTVTAVHKVTDRTDTFTVYVSKLLIYQTRNTYYYDDNGDYASDLEYNDMSKDELRDLDWVSWIDFTGYTPALHRADWEYMCTTLFSTGDLQDVILDMIDHFMDGTGTSYSNSTLTQKAYEHDSTQSYISAVESKLTTLLNTYDGDISALEYFASTRESNPFVQALKGTNQPVYNTTADKVNGLTICVDGLWGNKIEVTSFNLSGNTYTYTLHYTLYDHFGLDQNDVEKYGPLAGFRSWYVLQHYNEYNGAYRPFLTMIEFDVTVSGTYS